MIWPTICVDDFFPNHKEVVKFANSLNYTPAAGGEWPGTRTEPLHSVDNDFFTYATSKMVATLYPHQWREMTWRARSSFQKIDGSWQGQGWVHQDLEEVSCIIYLEGDENCGTSLYKQNSHTSLKFDNQEDKKLQNKNPHRLTNKEFKKACEENNERFTKTVSFESIPNRCIMFDSSQFHAVNNFNNHKKGNRLTMITFFEAFYRNDGEAVKFHAAESRRI